MNLSAVPVLYYHSVKYKRKSNWVYPEVTFELKNFNRNLEMINVLKFKTFFLDELYEHLKGKKSLPLNSIILTFDDGYLDNFTFVFPLLKKYKLKATFFVVPDFINDNDHKIRPTLEDYWDNKITLDELNNIDGYLNWEEMRLMEKSGLIDIQSHTLTHAKYPISDKIIDFVNPQTKIDWLYWNLFREDKPNFLTNPNYKIPLGYPIYESQKGNIAIKYEENGSLTEELINYVNKNGNENFFENHDWKEKLFSLSESIKKHNYNLYKKETEEEYNYRISAEILESKQIIEKNLEKKVNHLCWPYGGWNETTVKLAEESGYITTTIRCQKNKFKKVQYKNVDRIGIDNPKYQNILFYPYAIYNLFGYKF